MKLYLLALLVASLFAIPAAAQSSADLQTSVNSYWQIWSSLNPDKSAVLYVKDPDAVFFDVTPLKYKGWNEYAEGVKKAFGGFASAKFTPSEIKVVRHGNFAWSTDVFHGTLTGKDGKTTDLDGRHTAIWEKVGGKWLIIHDHVSVPMA